MPVLMPIPPSLSLSGIRSPGIGMGMAGHVVANGWGGAVGFVVSQFPTAPTARPHTSLGQRPRLPVVSNPRAESPTHRTSLRHGPTRFRQCRGNEPRRWRLGFLVLFPRALPWAGMSRAFGPHTFPSRRSSDLAHPTLIEFVPHPI